MRIKFRKQLDAPETSTVLAVAVFGVMMFLFGRIFMVLMGLDMYDRLGTVCWIEIVFHLICMAVVVPIMWEYMSFSWLMVGEKAMKAFCLCLATVLLVLVYALVLKRVAQSGELKEYFWVYESATPLLTNSMFLTSSYMVMLSPVFGTACAVLVAPVVTCCLFYATAFTKGYNVHPLLGYALVILATLFVPGVIAFVGMWSAGPDLGEWAVRLPIHLLCCKLYRDTDNIWMPIFAQAGVNLISCLLVIFTW